MMFVFGELMPPDATQLSGEFKCYNNLSHFKKAAKPQISGLAQSFFVPISRKEKLLHIRRRCSLEAFELRFALHYAIVMTISYMAGIFILDIL